MWRRTIGKIRDFWLVLAEISAIEGQIMASNAQTWGTLSL